MSWLRITLTGLAGLFCLVDLLTASPRLLVLAGLLLAALVLMPIFLVHDPSPVSYARIKLWRNDGRLNSFPCMARAGTMRDLLAGRIRKQRKRDEKSSVPPQRKGRQWTKRELDPVIILAGPEEKKKR